MKENTGALHVQLPVDVATFLLNEKRLDIHTLETRLKVAVMLIPNIHLETPNYSIARLRHDELNRSDAAEPSYKMATMPESDEEAAAAAAQSPVARMEAAVKSIAPAQRVPMARPAALVPPPTGMFDRIFGWFKKTLAEEPDAGLDIVPETKPRERAAARPERPRERKAPSARRPDTRNSEPRSSETRSNEPREAKAPRDPREPREPRADRNSETAKPVRTPRPPRPPRTEKPLEDEVRPNIEVADTAPPSETREPRTRRGRGGRGRNREDRPQHAAMPDDVLSQPHANRAEGDDSVTQRFSAVIESAPPHNTQMLSDPVTTAAPMVHAQHSLPLETRPPQSRNTPQAVLAASAASEKGLEQVETQSTSPSDSNDASRGDRPRRRRRPASGTSGNEPALQQVETAHVSETNLSPEPSSAPMHPTRRRQRPQPVVVNEPLIQIETGNPP